MHRPISRAVAWLLLPAALLLSGCFTIETNYVVEDDGSGHQTLRFTMPQEVMSSFGEAPPTVEELESEPEMEQMRDALGDRGSIEFFSSEEEGFGFELTINVEPSEDFGAALREATAAMMADAPEDMDLSMFEMAGEPPAIRKDGDEWVFEMAMAPVDPEAMSGLAGDETEGPGNMGDMAGMAAMFMDQMTIVTRLDLPGEVLEHNADEVEDDGTLVWTQSGLDAERTLSARSGASSKGFSFLLMLGAVAALGVAVVVAYLFYSRRSAAGKAA